jgi:hypothetical protein
VCPVTPQSLGSQGGFHLSNSSFQMHRRFTSQRSINAIYDWDHSSNKPPRQMTCADWLRSLLGLRRSIPSIIQAHRLFLALKRYYVCWIFLVTIMVISSADSSLVGGSLGCSYVVIGVEASLGLVCAGRFVIASQLKTVRERHVMAAKVCLGHRCRFIVFTAAAC